MNRGISRKIRQGITVTEGVFPISLENFYKEYLSGRRLSSYTLPELPEYMAKEADGKVLEATVEYNKRFSTSLACLAFALIAIPLGITTHRKETSAGFALSLSVAFTYFFFIIMADTFRGNASAYPAVLIWVPNVLFIALGSFLFWRPHQKIENPLATPGIPWLLLDPFRRNQRLILFYG